MGDVPSAAGREEVLEVFSAHGTVVDVALKRPNNHTNLKVSEARRRPQFGVRVCACVAPLTPPQRRGLLSMHPSRLLLALLHSALLCLLRVSSLPCVLQFGFVTMSCEAELQRCVGLDGQLYLRGGGGALRTAHTRPRAAACRRLVVSGLAAGVTGQQLAAAFRPFGALHEADTRVGLQLDARGGVLAAGAC